MSYAWLLEVQRKVGKDPIALRLRKEMWFRMENPKIYRNQQMALHLPQHKDKDRLAWLLLEAQI